MQKPRMDDDLYTVTSIARHVSQAYPWLAVVELE